MAWNITRKAKLARQITPGIHLSPSVYPQLKSQVCATMLGFLYEFQGIKLRSSHLQRKCCPYQAISTAQIKVSQRTLHMIVKCCCPAEQSVALRSSYYCPDLSTFLRVSRWGVHSPGISSLPYLHSFSWTLWMSCSLIWREKALEGKQIRAASGAWWSTAGEISALSGQEWGPWV